MTETQARRAADLLHANGHYEAGHAMDVQAERARKRHFQEMQQRCYDPTFADAYERDRMEGWAP